MMPSNNNFGKLGKFYITNMFGLGTQRDKTIKQPANWVLNLKNLTMLESYYSVVHRNYY